MDHNARTDAWRTLLACRVETHLDTSMSYLSIRRRRREESRRGTQSACATNGGVMPCLCGPRTRMKVCPASMLYWWFPSAARKNMTM